MGDFSIRCDLSGLPIPHGAYIFRIKMGRNQDKPQYRYPMSMPELGVMGDYGELDDMQYDENDCYIHVYPDLWAAAAAIWMKYMPRCGKASLQGEIDNLRYYYRRVAKESNDNPLLGPDTRMQRRVLAARTPPNTEWLRRFDSIMLWAPDDSPLKRWRDSLIMRDEPVTGAEIDQLRTFIAAFMSAGITGKDLTGGEYGDYCFEQYPTLKPEAEWYRAIANQIKKVRKKL